MTPLKDLGGTVFERLSVYSDGLLPIEEGTTPARHECNFFSWYSPALVFEPGDFKFAVQGLTSGTAIRMGTAEENRLLNRQAAAFANKINFIPDADGIRDRRDTTLVVCVGWSPFYLGGSANDGTPLTVPGCRSSGSPIT